MSEEQGLLQLVGSDKTTDEQAICRVALHAILAGEGTDRAGLVVATGLAREKVDSLLDGLIERGLAVVDPGSGRVIGSWGLSLIPTDHQLCIRERELFTWCALDAVGIPAGLGEDATITSSCHQCGVSVEVEISAGRLSHAKPADVQVWLAADQVGRSVVGFT